MFEARIQVRRHLQGVDGREEGAINDPVDAKEPTEDLAAKHRKRRGGIHTHFILGINWKFGGVVQLFFDPFQNQIDVVWCGYADSRPVRVWSPTILDPGWETFTRFEA